MQKGRCESECRPTPVGSIVSNVPFAHMTCSREGRLGVSVRRRFATRVWRQVTAIANESARIREALEAMVTVRADQQPPIREERPY